MDFVETLARAQTPHGEIALRRRAEVVELIVSGVFAMDSTEVTSELALADAAGAPPGRVLVGGLGLGYTAARLLENGAARLDVVELAGPLIEWAGGGVTETLGRVARDPRAHLHQADIGEWIGATTNYFDAILLDVDNGPSFLIHPNNARLYATEWLTTALTRLAPGGLLAVWCERPSPSLREALGRLPQVAQVCEDLLPVRREGREFSYALYRAKRC